MDSNIQTQTILIPGGLGYIGSHTVVCILESILKKSVKLSNTAYKVLIIDNLYNSTPSVLPRIHKILKKASPDYSEKMLEFQDIDLKNLDQLDAVFAQKHEQKEPISYIIHFAAMKAVGESMRIPLTYFDNNIVGSLNVLKCMEKHGCKNLIFSSSATVYGNNGNCKEDDQLTFTNPYGCTKLCVEHILKSMTECKADWKIISLRYFNPAGAHESGLMGEAPSSYPNNLFPYLEEVVVGKKEELKIFGKDYNTKDGTGVRDYIHVMDLAKAHTVALEKLSSITKYEVYNLGTGIGYSVLDILEAYSKAIGKRIPYSFAERRAGDVDEIKCVPEKANKELNWKAEKNLDEMCADSYRWKSLNPNGFEDKS